MHGLALSVPHIISKEEIKTKGKVSNYKFYSVAFTSSPVGMTVDNSWVTDRLGRTKIPSTILSNQINSKIGSILNAVRSLP